MFGVPCRSATRPAEGTLLCRRRLVLLVQGLAEALWHQVWPLCTAVVPLQVLHCDTEEEVEWLNPDHIQIKLKECLTNALSDANIKSSKPFKSMKVNYKEVTLIWIQATFLC